MRESDDEPSLLSKKQDERIWNFEESGAFSRDIGLQSILCQEVVDTHEEEEAYHSLLTQENLPETPETAGFEEQQVEPQVSTSPLSFLIRAADLDIESKIRGSGRNAIMLAGNAAKVSRPMPLLNKSPTTLSAGNATKVSHPMPIAKSLPPTNTPATTKPLLTTKIPAVTRPLPITKTPTGIVVGKTPIIITKAPAEKMTQNEKRRAERGEAQANEAHDLAQQATNLAAQAIASPKVSKQMLLSMVFVRTNPRSSPATWPPKGSIIPLNDFSGPHTLLSRDDVEKTHEEIL